ncbi:aldehyde dehydrogenase 6B2 [Perilla frutescens var. frutescens]|nr:aldehyde dehydrogenase 6B2 [Perilla frutescens var. frutescens]
MQCLNKFFISASLSLSNPPNSQTKNPPFQSNLEVKNHIVIMPDASADAAVDAVIESGFGASGTQREQKLVERAKELKVDAGTEPGTDIGPVISKEAKDRMCRLIQSGICSGARLVLDGRYIVVPRYGEGNFLGPTIMSDVTTSMDCYKEDVVGPVLLCMQADNLDGAISIVNSSKLRSGASIFTSSNVAARKFQNEVNTSLVGINVPFSLSLPLSTFNCSAVDGDLSFCGKADVHFYTQSKTVVQRWKEFPRGRAPSSHPHPPTFEIQMSSQRTSSMQFHGSERDSVGGIGSTAMPSSSEDLSVPLALHSASWAPETEPPRHKGSTLLPSSSLMNEDQSTGMHSVTPVDATSHGVLTSMPSLSSDGMFSSQTSKWSESHALLQMSENTLPISGRIDAAASAVPREAMNDPSPTTAERFYLPTMSRNENTTMMSFRHDSPLFPEKVHLISQQNEIESPASQRPEVSLRSTSDSLYLPAVSDDMGLTRMNEHAALQQASATAYSPNAVPPQTADAVPMYVASAKQRSDRASSSPSASLERVSIPSTSQEMYVQMPSISTEKHHREGVP